MNAPDGGSVMDGKEKRVIAALNMIEIAISELNAALPADENIVGGDLFNIMIAARHLRERHVKPENRSQGAKS